MATREPYFTKEQFEARVSKKKVTEIYDDNNDGTSDTDPIDGLRRDASSKVDSYLSALGIQDLNPSEIPDEVVRLSLDVAVALACQRHPEVMRQDWGTLMKQAEADLMNLRDGKTLLGAPPIAQPVNQGATVIPGDDARKNDPTERMWDRMGDF